ncbi:hypothetical protein ACFFJX_12630 [Pseudarcicella hirudinis]|uniref:hypothetical protein n=1 Tax=Pseudarcicella hirudinis TaxID=1079859 RepID=UPI0035ECD434
MDTKEEFDKPAVIPEPLVMLEEAGTVRLSGIDKGSGLIHLVCEGLEGKKVIVRVNNKDSGAGIVKDGVLSVKVSGSLLGAYSLNFIF